MNNMLENCEVFYPFLTDNAVCTIDIGHDELLIELDNGERYVYDDLEKTIRRLSMDRSDVTEEEFRREFGTRLRKVMFRKGLTQHDLAERSGISQVTISGYMRGKNVPSFYNLHKLAKALDCYVDDFTYI